MTSGIDSAKHPFLSPQLTRHLEGQNGEERLRSEIGARRTSRRLATAGIAILVSSTLAGCAASAPDEAQAAAVSFGSWAAAGDMAIRQWLDGSLPTHFAKRALDNAGEQAADQMKTLVTALLQARQSPALPMSRMATVLEALADAAAGLEHTDRNAIEADARRIEGALPLPVGAAGQ